jgi:hypothetical protein
MPTIASLNIASGTSPNWLKEAQESLVAAAEPGGMMGALQNAGKNTGSIKSFLANSQKTAANFALVSFSTAEASNDLIGRMAAEAVDKRVGERLNAALERNAPQKNYTPPKGLDTIVYFSNGSSLNTSNNILTQSDGKQIDITTGKEYIDQSALIHMANGAYLDTKNNILYMANGMKIDTVTGLNITT